MSAKLGQVFFFDTISVDALSQFFKAVFLVVSLLVVIASLSRYKDAKGADEFYALLLLATVGMMVVSSSIDLVTLFVGFELASLSTYALAAFDKSKRNLEAAMKYFIFGSVSSALMLFGFSLLYGMTGTTKIAGIASAALANFAPATVVALIFVIAGFAFKMASGSLPHVGSRHLRGCALPGFRNARSRLQEDGVCSSLQGNIRGPDSPKTGMVPGLRHPGSSDHDSGQRSGHLAEQRAEDLRLLKRCSGRVHGHDLCRRGCSARSA